MSTDNIRQFNKHYKRRRSRKKSSPKGSFPLFTFIFAVILVTGLFYAYRMSKDDTANNLPYKSVTFLKYITGKYVYYDACAVPPEKEDIWVMYNSLSDADKNVYDLFLDLVENRNGDKYTNGIIISNELLEEVGRDHFWNIYYAMCFDHPEYFFLFTEQDPIDASSLESDNYTALFYKMSEQPAAVATQRATFKNAAIDFLRDIDLSLSDEEIELAIHDKLIDLVSYDYEVFEELKSEDEAWDLGNTAYGALVCDSDGRKNCAVCGGYSFAFEYLLHEAGIPCAYVSGSAKNIPPSPDDQEDHAWNVVQISGKWYETDTTWDDTEFDSSIDYELFEALQKDTEKFNNLRHHYYNRTTAEMENLKATDATLFNIEGYYPYNAVYDSSHVRISQASNADEEIDEFLNSLIPIAK